jgi:Cu(I)/Ag(I) efflux system membrane protein CusA/SilA
VADAKKAVAEQVKFPPGYYVTWSGQFEYMERAIEKMKIVIPVTLLSIFLLLYLNFRRITETLIVMLSVPFALVGGVWLMWCWDTTCRWPWRSASSRWPAWRRRPA